MKTSSISSSPGWPPRAASADSADELPPTPAVRGFGARWPRGARRSRLAAIRRNATVLPLALALALAVAPAFLASAQPAAPSASAAAETGASDTAISPEALWAAAQAGDLAGVGGS